jgi:hypothetical protein
MMAVPMDCHATWAAMHAFSEDRGGEAVGSGDGGLLGPAARPHPDRPPVTFRARVTERTERHAKVEVTATVDGTSSPRRSTARSWWSTSPSEALDPFRCLHS